MTALGYDPEVGRVAAALERRWPPARGMRLLNHAGALPDEDAYRDILGASRLVLCKNGFQQIAEALASGARVFCLPRFGGVPKLLMPGHMAPFVHYGTMDAASEPRFLRDLEKALASRRRMPWEAALKRVSSPTAFAVNAIDRLMRRKPPTRAPSIRAFSPKGRIRARLGEFKRAFDGRDWRRLELMCPAYIEGESGVMKRREWIDRLRETYSGVRDVEMAFIAIHSAVVSRARARVRLGLQVVSCDPKGEIEVETKMHGDFRFKFLKGSWIISGLRFSV